jgi:hypothetical protein
VKFWILLAVLAPILLIVGLARNPAITLLILFGWAQYLARVLPRMTMDCGTVAVGTVAFVLFAAGIHALGRTWRPRTATAPWRLRWSLTGVALVLLMFTAGLAVIAIVHQVAWLSASKQPLFVLGVQEYSSSMTQRNHLMMIGMAARDHVGFKGSLPSGGTFAPDGTGLHSWETQILLFGFDGYYEKGIDLSLPWNHEQNAPAFKKVHPSYLNAALGDPPILDGDGYGLSHYSANVHLMGPNRSLKLADITDGLGNTLLVGEVNTAFMPWGHPCNWRDPAKGINRSPQGFGGPPSERGAWFAMADGSARFVSDRVSQEVLRALATPAGGEQVDLPSER